MQTDNRLLDDLTRIATSALGTLQGAKSEAETLIRQRLERVLSDMDLVTREEFEAVLRNSLCQIQAWCVRCKLRELKKHTFANGSCRDSGGPCSSIFTVHFLGVP